MDPFSTTAAVLQIIGQCASCSISLAKWIAQVKSVDQRLEDFAREVSNLKQTHESLQQSLQVPYIVEAAKSTNDSSGQLWSQVGTTLNDCRNTLIAINRTLDKISKPSIFGKPMKQLQESLYTGDLARYFQRIQNFNILLQLPMQMITINLQLSQQEINQINHQELAQHIVSVKETLTQMDDRIKRLRPSNTNVRRHSMSQGSTLLDAQADNAMCDNLEKYVAKAKNFISSATTVASERSTIAGSVVQYGTSNIDGNVGTLTQRQRLQINSWVGMPQQKPPTPAASENGFPPIHVQHNEHVEAANSGGDQINLKLAQTYVEHGQDDIEREQYAAAEENFREALELLKDHNFGPRLAFEPADIKLLLGRCCFHQDNYEEAITLFQSIATHIRSSADPEQRDDPLRKLTADYLLGQVYLQKKDYGNAEKHALKAFAGRSEILGEHDASFLEAVQLVVAVYRAMGREAKARAFSRWLTPHETASPKQRTVSESHQLHPLTRSTTVPVADVPLRSSNQSVIRPDHRLLVPTYTPPLNANRSASLNLPAPFSDDESTSTEFTRTSTKFYMAPSPARRPLEPSFQAVKEISIDSKDKGVSAGMKLLKGYDPTSRILVLRSDEMKRNLKKRGSDLGLAATGQGYAPIHFFCDLPEEHPAELEILIDAGVDLGAICYKAGVPGRDPMTPLQLSIERGHTTLSRIIINAFTRAASKGKPVPDINTMYGRDGLPPLLSACRRGQTMIVSQLLEYGAKVTQGFPDAWYGNSLLHDTCQRCDTAMVTTLLAHQKQFQDTTNPNSDIGFVTQNDKLGKTPLMYALNMSNVMNDQKAQKLAQRPECLDVLLRHAVQSMPGVGDFERWLDMTDDKGRNLFAYVVMEGDDVVTEVWNRYVNIGRNAVVGELE